MRPAKEPVRLRTKELNNGSKSLYLDIYQEGRRKYEFLKLYLVPETDKEARRRNRETLALAEAIKAERIVLLQRDAHGFASISSKGSRIKAADFVRSEAEAYEKRGSASYAIGLRVLAGYLDDFSRQGVSLKSIDRAYLLRFIAYLQGRGLKNSSTNAILSRLGVVLKRAVRAGLLESTPMAALRPEDKPKDDAEERAFLTLDEVRQMEAYFSMQPDNRFARAFLVSCFTGLRLSDVRALRWEHILTMDDGRREIHIKQQKTGATVVAPLTENALRYLPEHGLYGDSVFGMSKRSDPTPYVRKWAEAAGIKKHVSFHVARHTYATLLLTYGADLYTVSKLLGHADVKTTQIYAKIVDQKRREAVDLIPTL